MALIINIEKLERGYEGCLSHIIRTDKVQGPYHLDFTVVINARVEEYQTVGAHDVHVETSSRLSSRVSARTS